MNCACSRLPNRELAVSVFWPRRNRPTFRRLKDPGAESTNRLGDLVNVILDKGPMRSRQGDDRDFRFAEVLFKLNGFVACHEHIESGVLRCFQQLAVS